MKKGINGFTLIEILVSLGILVIIMVVASNMFFTILKSSSKAKILTEVKQNGNYAINVMARMIRGGEYQSHGNNFIEIKNPDGEMTEFRCYDEAGPPSQYFIASESGSLTGEAARITSDNVRVSSSCDSFITYSPPVSEGPAGIMISFTLSQLGTPSRPEERASVDFRTTVTFRNY